MAITATVALSPANVPYNAPSVAQVTISNSGGSAVTLVTLQPLENNDRPGAMAVSNSQAPINPITIPAGGSTLVTFTLVPFNPQVVPFSALQPTTFLIGANLITSDGSSVSATPATLTVSPPLAN